MCIASKNLRFLDLINYVSANTSLAALYKSYGVKSPKGQFPYQYFDSINKLHANSLPKREEFTSLLKNKTITEKEWQICDDIWKREGMSTFGDYVRYYNNHDVIGLVEVVEKMIAVEIENGLDIFKNSISLPGLTQQYLFQNLDKADYFTTFG